MSKFIIFIVFFIMNPYVDSKIDEIQLKSIYSSNINQRKVDSRHSDHIDKIDFVKFLNINIEESQDKDNSQEMKSEQNRKSTRSKKTALAQKKQSKKDLKFVKPYQPIQPSANLPMQNQNESQNRTQIVDGQSQQLISSSAEPTKIGILRKSARLSNRTPMKQVKIQEPSKSEDNQDQIILAVLEEFIQHENFIIFQEAKLRPNIKTKIRLMRQKLRKGYSLQMFEEDMTDIFKLFYNSSGQQPQIIQEVRSFQEYILETIEKLKQISQISNRNNELDLHSLQKPQRGASKRGRKPGRTKNRSQSRQDETLLQSSNMKQEQSLQSSFRGQLSKTPDKAPTKKRVKIVRRINKKMNQRDVASLGFNIKFLTSEELKTFCSKFTNQKKKRKGKSANKLFNFDLNSMQIETLIEMEYLVKLMLAKRQQKYEMLLPDQDDDFMIFDEGERKDGPKNRGKVIRKIQPKRRH